MDMYTLLYLKWINKDLLWSTGNFTQCYVAAWMGGEFGGESVQFSSVLNHVLLCDHMDCRMPGLPVQHQFPMLAQTYVH